MSATLIGIVTAIYTAIAVHEGYVGKPELAVVFGGYALANLGLIWATMR